MTTRAPVRSIAALGMATVGIAATAAACAGPQSAPAPSSSPSGASGEITVFAASSLTSVFSTLSEQFDETYPGTDVHFSFAGSTDLVAQLTQGAPADVFAAADETSMAAAVDTGLITGVPAVFAANTLTIVTRPGNPRGIRAFADLARPGVSVVLCAPQVPCGAAGVKLQELTGVTITPASEESSVVGVLGKVLSGEADAGLVYATDAEAAGGKVTVVAIPESGSATNRYPIALLADSRNPDLAERFVELVTGPAGRRICADAGFAVP